MQTSYTGASQPASVHPLVLKATLRRSARGGLNRIAFSGRVRSRALAPGRYRAAFTAANTAGTSALRALSFRIAAP